MNNLVFKTLPGIICSGILLFISNYTYCNTKTYNLIPYNTEEVFSIQPGVLIAQGHNYLRNKNLYDALIFFKTHGFKDRLNKTRSELAESFRTKGNYLAGVQYLHNQILFLSENDAEMSGSVCYRPAGIFYASLPLYISNLNYPGNFIEESRLLEQINVAYQQDKAIPYIMDLSRKHLLLIRSIWALAIIMITVILTSAWLLLLLAQKNEAARLQIELLEAKRASNELSIKNGEFLLEKQESEKIILKSELANKESSLISKLLIISKNNEFMIQLLERLKQLNMQVANGSSRRSLKEIIDLIKYHSQTEINKEIEYLYASGNSEFIKRLSEKHQDLTANEKRLCYYINMNLSTKEISDLTFQSCRAIEMARHRLRCKFGLQRNSNLNKYLSSFTS